MRPSRRGPRRWSPNPQRQAAHQPGRQRQRRLQTVPAEPAAALETESKPATTGAKPPAAVTKPPVTPSPTSPAAKPAPPPTVAASAPMAPAALDLNALKEQLKETKAIGVFTKLSLKNQVDDLLQQFRDYSRARLRSRWRNCAALTTCY